MHEEVGFDHQATRKHILNHLTERQRCITRGHSYKLPDGRSAAGRKMKDSPKEGQLYTYKCVQELYIIFSSEVS